MNKHEILLKDMTYNTHYEFLEYSSNKSEIDEVAKKAGLKFPAHDIAIFKGIYGFVDRQNKNGCTISKEEVEKALDTLSGKAVDFDHLRQRVVGYWLHGKIEKDEIVAYGVFFKGNFSDDYELIKKLMASDNLGISFEAWGNKEFANDGSYRLNNIEFAGGALLLKTTPAFDGAGVLEMSNKDKVLEFSKVMTAPESFVSSKNEIPRDTNAPNLREAPKQNLFLYKQDIGKKCSTCLWIQGSRCEAYGFDTKENYLCDGWSLSREKEEQVKKIREESLNKKDGGNKMEEKIKELEKELSSVKEEVVAKKAEIDSLTKEVESSKATIEELKSESEEAKVKIEEIEKAKATEIEKARKDATTIAERKAELGEEFSKNVDLLDNTAYENAKLRKTLSEKEAEISKLKENKGVEDKDADIENASLEIGSGDKSKGKDKVSESRKRIQEEAWKEVE